MAPCVLGEEMKMLYRREVWEGLWTCGYLLFERPIEDSRNKRGRTGFRREANGVICEFQRRTIGETLVGLQAGPAE